MWFHLVAQAKNPPLPLIDERIATHLFEALMHAFPSVANALLTWDRLELIPRGKNASETRDKLSRVLAELPRLTQGRVPLPKWEPIELPRPITDRAELDRQVDAIDQQAAQMLGSAPVPSGLLFLDDEFLPDLGPLLFGDPPILVPLWPGPEPTDPTAN